MSHDRGCFKCFEDPISYADCKRSDCPKHKRFAVEPGGDKSDAPPRPLTLDERAALGVPHTGSGPFVGDPGYRSGGDQSAKNHDAIMAPIRRHERGLPEGVTQADLDAATPLPPLGDSRRVKGVVEVAGEMREHDGRSLGRKLPADAEITRTHTRAEIDAAIASVRDKPVERVTRIITVTEPGYDVALFMNEDGGAEAVITRPGLAPTGINIAPPAPGRRIVIERVGPRFQVVYKDVS